MTKKTTIQLLLFLLFLKTLNGFSFQSKPIVNKDSTILVDGTSYYMKIKDIDRFNKEIANKDYKSISRKYSLEDLKALYYFRDKDSIPNNFKNNDFFLDFYKKYSKDELQYFTIKALVDSDHRIDYDHVVNRNQRRNFNGVGFIIHKNFFDKKDDNFYYFKHETTSLRNLGICPGQAFANQTRPKGILATVFAINNKTVLTVKHIFSNSNIRPSDYYIVFGFMYKNNKLPSRFSASNVFKISSIENLTTTKTEKRSNDYTIIRTARRIPSKYRLEPLFKELNVGAKLYTIGHCSFLPLKLNGSASIKGKEDGIYLTNLDGLPGSSGSPVFFKDKVVGIYLGGNNGPDNNGYITTCISINSANDCLQCKLPISCNFNFNSCHENILPLYHLKDKI
ncbi:hypothetical protein [uncultured Tenacibaculum sp.]|uniref:trypsin-like serine peptidase n=1 Tax=uncultured Tenacibaculum sp. TaxID=174713 RepID=UPI00261AEF9D|nr:hypothetical protein [uncultured Tenacibaculum sp.]